MTLIQPVARGERASGQHEVLALDERLREINRVPGHGNARQHVSVAHEVLGQRRLVAHRQTVAANPALLDVCGRDGQHVAFPPAGGKTHPRVGGDLRRVRTTVHVNRACLIVGADAVLDGHELLRVGIPLFPDAQVQRPPVDVRRHVHPTLLFRESDPGGIPALGKLAGGGIDWKTQVVTQFRARNPLREILLIARPPRSREIGLCERGRAREC
jgi:hypothetical protein